MGTIGSDANTLSTYSKRNKYMKSMIETALRESLVAEKICLVDRSNIRTIQNPYSTAPAVELTKLTGTYTPATHTITDDTLTVNREFKVSEHVFDFEQRTSQFDLIANRLDDQAFAVAKEIDQYVLNMLCEDGSGTYSTPSGGFTTAANVNTIMANLLSKVAGYQEAFQGQFLVIENTDLPGFAQAGADVGFNFSDNILKNGLRNTFPWMGVEVYVVRTGTFEDATYGNADSTDTVTNSGHRVFGVKNMATYAAPRDIAYEEKSVSGRTGKELVTYGYIGFKLWTPKASLIVDITLTA